MVLTGRFSGIGLLHFNMADLKRLLRFSFFALFLFGCGGNGNDPSPGDNSKDRGAILTHWADNIILPSYEKFAQVFQIMIEKRDAFTSSPDINSLAAFRDAWTSAYLEWEKVELFEFGPADKYTMRNFFNIYPADVDAIVSNMNNPLVNLELPASYATQGFPALDYLINGMATDDASIINAYTSDPDAAKRIAYLGRITDRMQTLLSNVITEWKGSYRDAFIGKTGLDIGSSTGLVVNAYILHYERYIRSGKIGIPSGIAIGGSGTVYPEKVEAFFKKDISLALASNAHAAAWNFFKGKSIITEEAGPSFQSYLNALGAKDVSTGTLLSSIINDQFTTIEGKLNQLTPNFQEQIQTNNDELADTYTAMQKLVRLLKVDMTSAMSVTITYTDNDGD